MGPDFLDRFSRGQTVCHRLPAGLKLAITIAVIATAVITPVRYWPVHGCLACLLFIAHSLAEIPLRYLLHRILYFLPFVLVLAVSLPAGGGSELAAGIFVRSVLAFLAGLWLVNVTPYDDLLVTLRRLHVPVLLIALLAFMYRYAFVVFDELGRMREARAARSFGRSVWWRNWGHSAQLLGMLLIRSMNRAERVYGAMCARGWNGEIRTLDHPEDR